MSGHATKSTAASATVEEGVSFPLQVTLKKGKGLGKMAPGKGSSAEANVAEIPGGKLFHATQMGFTLEVKVEAPGRQAIKANLYIDTGSALTWLEDDSGKKLFNDVSHMITIHYLDETAFRGVPLDKVKVTIAPSSTHPVVLENRYLGLGHLYEYVPVPQQSREPTPMQISPSTSRPGTPSGDKKPAGESGSTTPEYRPGTPQEIARTEEMGAGMIGFSPKTGSKRMLYHINNGHEEQFKENIKTLMSDLGAAIGLKRRVFFYFTPHGHEAESKIMFGKPTAGTFEKITDPSSAKKVDYLTFAPVARESGHWRLNAEAKIGNVTLPIEAQCMDAHLDTGYSRLALPRQAYLAYKKATKANNKGGRLVVSKKDYDKLPALTITFKEGQALSVSFKFSCDAQLWPQEYNKNENADPEYQFTQDDHILIIGNGGSDYVIGSTPMRYFLWGFDDKDGKIFLGKTKYTDSEDTYNGYTSNSGRPKTPIVVPVMTGSSQHQAAASSTKHSPPSPPEKGQPVKKPKNEE